MNLIKTSILNAAATIIRTVNSFLINKIIATFVGPSGMAFIGQFQSFATILINLACGSINTGLVKYTAEFRTDQLKLHKLWSSAAKISGSAAIAISIVTALFSKALSRFFFKTEDYSSILLIFSATLILAVLNNLLLSILNGLKEISKYVLINIVSSFLSLLLTGILAYFLGLYGALLSAAISQSIIFFASLALVLKSHWFKCEHFLLAIDRTQLLNLLKFTAMAAVSAICVPLSQIIIRDYIGRTLSWEEAGFWQGLWRISDTYLLMITMTLNVYYIPRISEIINARELRREIAKGFKLIMPAVIVFAWTIFVLRDVIIKLLYTEAFFPMRQLFAYQMIGDCVKIASWLLGNILLAKAMTKIFITTEIIFSASFVLLSILFIREFGLVGVTYAFAVNYILYFAAMAWVLRKRLFGHAE